MAESISISCPECQKQMKAPATLVGKKIRCKGCEHVFVVKDRTAVKTAPEPKKAKRGAQAAPSAPATPVHKPTSDDPDDDGKPYDETQLDDTYRCPHCANEMESEDAIICLYCGYNTRTREAVTTRKVYETTTWEQTLWTGPAVLAVLAFFGIIGGCIYYHFELPYVIFDSNPSWEAAEKDKEVDYNRSKTIAKLDTFKAYMFHFAIELWIFVVATYLCYLCAKFAYGRLIKHPRPPEILKQT